MKIQNYLKFRVFIILQWFFFPVKAEMLYFSKIGKGDQKGDHLELYICLKDQFGFEIFKKNFKVETNIDLQVVPLLVPLSNFWKVQHLSFHWEKNNSKSLKLAEIS